MNTEEPKQKPTLPANIRIFETIYGTMKECYEPKEVRDLKSQLKELTEERDEAVRLLRDAFGVLDDSPIYDATEIKDFLSISTWICKEGTGCK